MPNEDATVTQCVGVCLRLLSRVSVEIESDSSLRWMSAGGNCRVEDLVNRLDIRPADSTPGIMATVYSDQAASYCSTFAASGVNMCDGGERERERSLNL